jgi:hypothetical protein
MAQLAAARRWMRVSKSGGVNQVNLKRIQHALRWRTRYASDVLGFYAWSYGQRLQLASRWYMPLRQRVHRLPGLLIVSLTSYPPRFEILPLTLRSLLRQTVKPDHLILWIASKDFSLLPRCIFDLQPHGLEIRITERDLKSYKKIIPALDQFPEAFIVTADDDVYYWSSWLEQLVAGVELPAKIVTCHWADEIIADAQGRYLPYRQWVPNTSFRGKAPTLFPVGIGGVLYPPGVLAHKPEDRAAAFSLCPQGDDIWLYWIGRRNGASYKTVGRRRTMEGWPGSQDQALWRSNFFGDENDQQILKMAQLYGYPKMPV